MKQLRGLLAAAVIIAAAGAIFLYIHVTMPGWYARLWYPLDHTGTIVRNSRAHNLDPALVAAVIFHESGYDEDNTSRAGAIGLMQLMPATAQWIASHKGANIELSQLNDPETNVEYGCWYLRYLLDRFGDQQVALAAYNAGAENVERWLETARADGRPFEYTQDIPYHETSEYIAAVEKSQAIYRRAYAGELEVS